MVGGDVSGRSVSGGGRAQRALLACVERRAEERGQRAAAAIAVQLHVLGVRIAASDTTETLRDAATFLVAIIELLVRFQTTIVPSIFLFNVPARDEKRTFSP
uniref:Uncharacterized protein n=1 Tax=Plectus sambesii TaxID=2011161 RepID=A0A914VCI6_9BILA